MLQRWVSSAIFDASIRHRAIRGFPRAQSPAANRPDDGARHRAVGMGRDPFSAASKSILMERYLAAGLV